MTTVKHQNEALESGLAKFTTQWPHWEWLRERLKKAGLELTSAKGLEGNEARGSWVFFAKPSEALVNHFDLAPEVLILCSPWRTMQAKDLERVENVFQKEFIRVDPGFALVLTGDPEAQANLRPVLPDKRRYLFLHGEAFKAVVEPQAFVRDLLRDGLGSRRLFDIRLPAVGRHFFGREKELEGLERDVNGGQCVGVFGLRKVGKTSLLRRLAQKLRETGKIVPVEVDLQEVPFKRRNLDGLVDLIGRRLDGEVDESRFRAPTRAADPQQRLVDTIEHVQRLCGGRMLLVLDEYEVLLSGRGIPPLDGVELLTWLRGLAQGYPAGFGFLLAGRNATLIAPARIGGADNPMYRFLRHLPLSGLADEACREMVTKIGRRMALRFEYDALSTIVNETGGHPALARTLGNLVDEHVPTAKRAPATIDRAMVGQVLPRFSREIEEDMRELIAASNDFDGRAGDYLVSLAHEVPWAKGASTARITDALIGYGILRADTHEFRIGRLATWLRENYAPPAKVAHG